ncbi:aryl-alcohol dehydrogenase-like predicted oxidoreductase [Cricetibacter osteomyelitidis]|uniref:Aryl-alcohol dehydrogenase-like predicted oxidoreductase n=1 Tax=Cricetibacter osteomyelitidis TaxID=1521931 RepID=A0A4R2T1H4_9PAST|nr:aldo/keto reductase [Cricetibacter osteomyelitidis]TCP95980.1 aryl-alcohol dehydrogenase-like predicted oxidoreductase [Cricetibacter osteomyelitidis]
MKKRNIGSLAVSPIGMGCMGFSHGYGKAPSEEYALNAIRQAYEFGCNFFDTAEVYGREQFFAGHNELLLGKAVKDFRQHTVLATKLHLHQEELENATIYQAVRRHLEKSMKNLQTDYVDLYYLHRVNNDVAVEDVAEAMGKLRQEGLIKEWGLSQVGVSTLKKVQSITPVTAVQNLYSMLERGCEQEVFPYCLENNITVVPFSPIASGFLSGKITATTEFEKEDDVRKFVPQLSQENIAANQPILDILAKFSAEKNATNAQISLAWMLHKYPNVVPIPGSKNLERILENLGGWNVELTDEEFNALETALNACTVHGHRGFEETEQTTFGLNKEKK